MENFKLQQSAAAKNDESLLTADNWTQAILDIIDEGIVTTDELGTINSFNSAAERIFRYEPGEVIGQNVNILMAGPHHGEHECYICTQLLSGRGPVVN